MDCVTLQLLDHIIKFTQQLLGRVGVIAGAASSGIIGVSANNAQQTVTPPSGITTNVSGMLTPKTVLFINLPLHIPFKP